MNDDEQQNREGERRMTRTRKTPSSISIRASTWAFANKRFFIRRGWKLKEVVGEFVENLLGECAWPFAVELGPKSGVLRDKVQSAPSR